MQRVYFGTYNIWILENSLREKNIRRINFLGINLRIHIAYNIENRKK